MAAVCGAVALRKDTITDNSQVLPIVTAVCGVQSSYAEMEGYARDSSDKILAIVDQTRKLLAKMKVDLSREDMDGLMEGQPVLFLTARHNKVSSSTDKGLG